MKYFLKPLLFLVSVFWLLLPVVATAEEIPIMVWERGQVQNVVLGKGDSSQNWELYLRDSSNRKSYSFQKSNSNQDGFVVYSLNVPDNLPISGYIIEAKSAAGETKQVAGVQVVASTSLEITRVPFELSLLLIGFSILILMLVFARGMKIQTSIKSPEYFFVNSKLSTFQLRVLDRVRAGLKESLVKTLVVEELLTDLRFAKFTTIFGILSFTSLSLLHYQSGNWIFGSSFLIIFCILSSTFSISYGILTFTLALTLSLLNIASAKSMADILAILLISCVFVAPVLLNQLYLRLLPEYFQIKASPRWIFGTLSSLLATFNSYLLLVLFESIESFTNQLVFSKMTLALLMFLIFLIKNLKVNEVKFQSEFLIVRPLGPLATGAISTIISLVTYLWTSNVILTIFALFFNYITFATNWIAFSRLSFLSLKRVDFKFAAGILLALNLGIYASTRILPLDIVNRSHLILLFIFLINFLVALYVWVANFSQESLPKP